MTKNPIIFVSLGPGEAELITLKGLRALQQADIIFFPATRLDEKNHQSRAALIMNELNIESIKLTPFHVPMSKDRTQVLANYEEIANKSIALHNQGLKVVIVAEGDASFYSSTHYIFEQITKQGLPAFCIAGVPAFIASGSLAGIHIAKLEEPLLVLPKVQTEDELVQYLQQGKNVVIMKLSQSAQHVHSCLKNHPEFSYHYFENVGQETEFYSNNKNVIDQHTFPYFSLMIIQPTI